MSTTNSAQPTWTPNKLRENTVFEIQRGGGGSTIERLLWVDHANDRVFLIDVHLKTARDYATSLSGFVDALNCGGARPVLDPYRRLSVQAGLKVNRPHPARA